ncbi:Protein kinase-like domain protein [Metarhizium rileyi]|uniref:Protein kinase-like domain protein n=1 Tax=Metarhizium rileyi (strain RCEF 4871) TaxID=1649241 RepID=A0A166X3F3_METRR|nr:Protein kinase-like domain protein [Metarhizium rileyi RCEF 4871]
MLLNYVEPKRRGILGTMQYLADKHSREHLHRWAIDLSDTLGSLHQAGCIWEDAKPENVLVDKDDNAWIIDFGRGYTCGWVLEEQQCTQEGNLGAMEKIRQWLEVYDGKTKA